MAVDEVWGRVERSPPWTWQRLRHQTHLRSANAGCFSSAAKGHLLDGVCWFATVFSLATSHGLVSIAFVLVLLISRRKHSSALATHFAASHALGSQPPGLF